MAGLLRPSAPLIALAGWLVPGGGYWLLGKRPRALVIGITILLLYLLGILFGGIRVVDVPGYDALGQPLMVEVRRPVNGRAQIVPQRALTARPLTEIADKPWFIPQSLMGPINFIAAKVSLVVSRGADSADSTSSFVRRSHGRMFEIGTLYTAIAGMLNLLAIIDSTSLAPPGGKR